MALQNLKGVMELPQTLWKRLYKQLYLAEKGLCSICGRRGGSYQRKFFSFFTETAELPSQLRFCVSCWTSELMDEEVAQQILKSSLQQKYQELEDMDITLMPSFSSTTGRVTKMMLLC